MKWEPRPTPHVTPETEVFWKGASEGRFLLRECEDCGNVHYYPRARCPDCFGESVTWIEASGKGTIYTCTALESMSGWPEESLPLILAFVELDEGPKVLTNLIDCVFSEIHIGERVSVHFIETENENIGIPVFSPLSE